MHTPANSQFLDAAPFVVPRGHACVQPHHHRTIKAIAESVRVHGARNMILRLGARHGQEPASHIVSLRMRTAAHAYSGYSEYAR